MERLTLALHHARDPPPLGLTRARPKSDRQAVPQGLSSTLAGFRSLSGGEGGGEGGRSGG